MYNRSNNVLERFSNKNETSTVIDQRDCDLYYPISNQFRAMLVCLQDFDLKIFEKGAGWDSDEGVTWFDPGPHETLSRISKAKKRERFHQEKREKQLPF